MNLKRHPNVFLNVHKLVLIVSSNTSNHICCLASREHVPCRPIHQNHLLLVRDNLWLCEFVETSTGFEDQAVLQHKLLYAAASLHVQHLEPGRINWHQTVGPFATTNATYDFTALKN